MKTEIRHRWIEALRSKTYKQGQSVLRSVENRFCCLGVLCDLVDAKAWKLDADRFAHSGYIGHLPGAVGAVTDLNSDQCFTLMGMNDNGQSFDQIADWIEKNVSAN